MVRSRIRFQNERSLALRGHCYVSEFVWCQCGQRSNHWRRDWFRLLTVAVGVVGTVSVTHGLSTLTSSSSTSNLIAGMVISIVGDSSAGSYTIGGSGPTSWTISPVYGGTTASGLTAQTTRITFSNSQTFTALQGAGQTTRPGASVRR